MKKFTRPETTSWLTMSVWYLRRAVLPLFRIELPCQYVGYRRHSMLEHGYLIMDYIETTEETALLSDSWDELCHDQVLRTNFLEDLSRIMLSLSRYPLARIGSWTLDNPCCPSVTRAVNFEGSKNNGLSLCPRTGTFRANTPLQKP